MAALTETGGAIRHLNDQLRQRGAGGMVMLTQGVQALGADKVMQIQRAVALFDAFDGDNDPHGEHDFGTVQVLGHTVFFKIDYYDCGLRYHSSDPADPAVTSRVMTLMLPEEY